MIEDRVVAESTPGVVKAPLVFATVGTHHDGFPRMLRALETVVADELIVQHGHGTPPSNATLARPAMPFAEMLQHFQEADIVITHAGVGSILLSLHHGHVPIVVPRQHRLGEHVDDHQVEMARVLAARNLVVAREAAELTLDDLTAAAAWSVRARPDVDPFRLAPS